MKTIGIYFTPFFWCGYGHEQRKWSVASFIHSKSYSTPFHSLLFLLARRGGGGGWIAQLIWNFCCLGLDLECVVVAAIQITWKTHFFFISPPFSSAFTAAAGRVKSSQLLIIIIIMIIVRFFSLLLSIKICIISFISGCAWAACN